MNIYLSHCCISNIRRIGRSYFLYKSKCDFVKFENFNDKVSLSDNIKRDINKNLLNKICSAKDQKIKQKLIKTIIKVNSHCNLEKSTIDCLLRSKIGKIKEKINRNMKLNTNSASHTFSSRTRTIEDNQSKKTSEIDNVSRPIRKEPGEVIWGFIPKEWVTFFVPITGQSGFYTLLVTLGTYLFSKEIYVCDHEYYNGISMLLLCIYAVKKQGPILAKYLDKEIDNYERGLNTWKEKKMQNLKDSVLSEMKCQESAEGQKMLIQAKRENVHLQREAEFRKRQMDVYENITRILNYHVECEKVKRFIQHKNLIQWVTKEVEKSLTPELKEKYMQLCMADIKEIFKRQEK